MLFPLLAPLVAGALLAAAPAPAVAQPDDMVLQDAREALRKRDRQRLAADRAAVMAASPQERHPLAMWVDYWELSNRLPDATVDEVDDFYARWPTTYVEDRLRNDWLLELGRRQDWTTFTRDYPRFRMNDDREVSCYALLADHTTGRRPVKTESRVAWYAQRDADDGCALLAQTLYDAQVFTAEDVWRKVRLATEQGRPRAAQRAAAVLGTGIGDAVGEVNQNPARYLLRKASAGGRGNAELTALAIARMASNDYDAAAGHLQRRWQKALPRDLASWAWAQVARQAALGLSAEASVWYRRAESLASKPTVDWTDDMRGWQARAAMRNADWPQVLDAIAAMSESERSEPTWVYWKAQALKSLAADGPHGAKQRADAQALLQSLSGQLHFYGKLAAEDLGEPIRVPDAPAPLTAAERAAMVKNSGLDRALMLIAVGLRSEGVREWNFSLRGMDDRQLLAAAELACNREVWDRCNNTSERTKAEVDFAQRFPMPHRAELVARANEAGLDPAYVYGLIRQESRFVVDARSGVGASGLMQVMPSTARWTAKKLGLPYKPEMISDLDTNLRIGTGYLKLVLDDFGGSMPLAAAAYNAGPSRPRKWREGPVLDAAAWAENIPFNETRDYVKKVLSNTTWYAALLGQPAPSLRARLGRLIGPRDSSAPPPNETRP
jgi:soluble lytic murein transglycosylase